MLVEFLLAILEEEVSSYMLFLYSGEPRYFRIDVEAFMDRKFPQKWILKGLPMSWPPHTLGFNTY
jgi:hypothetical protein